MARTLFRRTHDPPGHRRVPGPLARCSSEVVTIVLPFFWLASPAGSRRGRRDPAGIVDRLGQLTFKVKVCVAEPIEFLAVIVRT